MPDEENTDNLSKKVEAVTELVKAVPVYQDAIQPAAKEIGKSLETTAKLVNVALAPFRGIIWSYEQIEVFIHEKVAPKLQYIPPERIITPNLLVAGPTIEALRFAGQDETLSDLYANLLATSIDSETAEKAHPGFVEILKNMSPDEAKIIRLYTSRLPKSISFPIINLCAKLDPKYGSGKNDVIINFSHLGKDAKCEHQHLTPNYLDNLCRLGLLKITNSEYLAFEGLYEPLENDEYIISVKETIAKCKKANIPHIERGIAEITNLGEQFLSACLIDKSQNSTAPTVEENNNSQDD